VFPIAVTSRVHAQITQAQQPRAETTQTGAMPDAPQAQQQDAKQKSQSSATATISGTVVDTNGDVVEGARVAVRRTSGAEARIVASGANGQFEFSGLPPGPYKLTVTGPGMSAYASPEINLEAGADRILPTITLAVEATSSSVTVTADKQELAEEQVQIAVQQRVFSVLPNFYTTFDWNAPPLLTKQKFKLSLRATFDPTAFAIIAGVAGAEQYRNVFPGFGTGWEGYGKRYGATFANHVTDQTFTRAIYPSLFHQDARYFYKGQGSVKSRSFYALSRVFVARGDDGRQMPNYSGVLGKFTSGAISNLYYPESERGAHLVWFNGLIEMGGEAVDNLIKEFLLKSITSNIPKGANGQQ
jgi:hypothetical protein